MFPLIKLGSLALPANAAPKQLKPGSRRWLGKPGSQIAGWKPPVEPNAPQPPALPATVERPANPEIKPVRLAAPPKVDGELDDECWKTVAPIGSLFLLGKKEWATQPTEVRLGYDNANLTWGFNICRNERPSKETFTWAPLTGAAFHVPDRRRPVFRKHRLPTGCPCGSARTATADRCSRAGWMRS